MQPDQHRPEPAGSPAWTALDTGVLITLVAAALAVRIIRFGDLGLSHFDEAVYALAGLKIAGGRFTDLFPNLHMFSPPLFFTFSALGMVLAGPGDGAHLAVAILSGVACVGAVYVAARDWFGRGAAFVGAAMLCFSDFHILFSRVGLTDSLFCALFLLAVWLFSRSDERQSWGNAVLAGLVTGAAWNTKYHGWLAVVVAGAALVPRAVIHRSVRTLRQLGRVFVGGSIALLLYLPWFLYVDRQRGGYAALVANHRSFLDAGAAIGQAGRQLEALSFLEGSLTRVSLALLLLGAALFAKQTSRASKAFLAALAVASMGVGGWPVAVALAGIGISRMVKRPTSGAWYALAFFGLFTVLTPLYHPYSRLLLPWFTGLVLWAGVGVAELGVSRSVEEPRRPLDRLLMAASALIVIVTVTTVSFRGLPSPAAPFAATDALRDATSELVEQIPHGLPVAVLGEPAVVFYLRQEQVPVWPVNTPEQLDARVEAGERLVLVGGIYSRRIEGEQSIAGWQRRFPDNFTLSARILVRSPGEVRLLDDFPPERAKEWRRGDNTGDYDLEVFEVVFPVLPDSLPEP